jgi:hypothetical protein
MSKSDYLTAVAIALVLVGSLAVGDGLVREVVSGIDAMMLLAHMKFM